MGNWDDGVVDPASGVEVAVDESETAELAESPALADKQPREKSETITKTERQEGHFMAGSPLKSEEPHATRSTSRRAGIPRTELCIIPGAWDFWPPIPMPPKIRHLPGLSKEFRISSQVFLLPVTKREKMAVGTEARYSNSV
jgi:hypothetical protein